MSRFGIAIVILVNCCFIGHAARILGVFPYPAPSHQIVLNSLTVELSKRGHELTVFTTHPVKDVTLKNYTQIDLSFLIKDYLKDVSFFDKTERGHFAFIQGIYDYGVKIMDELYSHPVMQDLIAPNSTAKFDLILVHFLYWDSLYALSARFKAPMIGVSSLPPMAIHHYILGNPLSAAFSPDPMLGYTDRMNFWERLHNFYYVVRQIYEFIYFNVPRQEKVVRKYFDESVPPIEELWRNVSAVLYATHPFYTYARPDIPSIIQIGGFRMKTNKDNLSDDLKTVLDNAKQGFIYFSLGSNVKSKDLPSNIRNAFLDAFAELPYQIIWKFEENDLPNKPKNVIAKKWLPQREILSHPNLILFMYQGGLQSTEEAIDSAVPVLGFPVFSDQVYNLRKLENYGIAKQMRILHVRKEPLKAAIQELVTNSSYRENMKKMRHLLSDVPYDPLEHAMWWIEHVIRHKGAPHIYNRSREMRWYQIEMYDIALFLIFIFIALIYCTYLGIRYLTRELLKQPNKNDERKKQ